MCVPCWIGYGGRSWLLRLVKPNSLYVRLSFVAIPACAQWCIFSIVRANFQKYDLYSAPIIIIIIIARALPLATSTTVLSGLDFCANCDFCVKSWVRGICMWRILWFWCFLMIRRRIRVLHVDQFGRSQDRSRPVFVPTQTNSNEKGIQGLQGFYFFCANCIKRDELIEPTGPNRSFHFV